MTDQLQTTATEPAHPGAFDVRATTPDDHPWIHEALIRYWASTVQVSRGRLHKADELPGFGAWVDEQPVGLLTYDIRDGDCEIVTHNSLSGHGGIGSCLLAEVRKLAREQGCKRLWCVTTNDNTPALRFYQRREFELVALHKNAITESRKLKSEIPDTGLDGIRIRHELELEYVL